MSRSQEAPMSCGFLVWSHLQLASEPPGGSCGGAHGAVLSDGQSPPMQLNRSDSLCAWAIDVFPNRLALISNELSSAKWVSWLLATGHIQRMDICRRRKMSIRKWVKCLDVFVVADYCQLRIKVVINNPTNSGVVKYTTSVLTVRTLFCRNRSF